MNSIKQYLNRNAKKIDYRIAYSFAVVAVLFGLLSAVDIYRDGAREAKLLAPACYADNCSTLNP